MYIYIDECIFRGNYALKVISTDISGVAYTIANNMSITNSVFERNSGYKGTIIIDNTYTYYN